MDDNEIQLKRIKRPVRFLPQDKVTHKLLQDIVGFVVSVIIRDQATSYEVRWMNGVVEFYEEFELEEITL